MNLMKKQRFKKQMNEIIKTNHDFNEFLESLTVNYPLHTRDQENLATLQEHLNNMSVIFSQMQDNMKSK